MIVNLILKNISVTNHVLIGCRAEQSAECDYGRKTRKVHEHDR